jgi:N-acylneuraminate cytidylyltransferase
MNKVVAFIPARYGSQRIPNKNIYPLNGHPLMAYSIQAAKDSGVFDRIVVSTDSLEYKKIAEQYIDDIIIEPLPTGQGDIKWVRHALSKIDCDVFSILRPTSPFRTGETIRRAWTRFNEVECDSIRAVEKCKQHPYKMWEINVLHMKPVIGELWEQHFNKPYQILPEIYVQNASLEIAHSYCVKEMDSISGTLIAPFYTSPVEGIDINEPEDIQMAELLIGRVEMANPCKVK